MASADQVKGLLRSYSQGDGAHFAAVALQIAADAARSGNGDFAKELRNLVEDIRRRQAAGKIGGTLPIATPRGELAALLAVTYPKTRLSEMVLEEPTLSHLKRVLVENRNQSALRSHRLSPRRKLLLVGPPGCGKTMSAAALAGELKLPLFSVQLHGLITKFMGETAAKLHQIFGAMLEARGVYLFDEFDAIGSDRGAKNDVGEIRRVLNSFLQFLEMDESESVIVAATNYEAMLDEALFRRFDDVVRYERPTPDQVVSLIENRLLKLLGKVEWAPVKSAARGLSHSEVGKACDDAAKECVLSGRGKITTDKLVSSLKLRRSKAHPRARSRRTRRQ